MIVLMMISIFMLISLPNRAFWTRNSKKVFTSFNFKTMSNGTLVASKMSAEMTGEYQCNVTSSWGNSLSNFTTVKLSGK